MNDLRTSVDHARNNEIKHITKLQAEEILQGIEDELQANASATKYATFFNSDTYVAPEDATTLNDTEENPTPGYFNAL